MIKDFLKEIYLRIRKILLFPILLLRRVKILEEGEIKKILFLRHDRIGDMVLSTPALRALKEGIPRARLTVLVSSINRDILLGNPFVDEIIVYEKGFLKVIKMIRELRRKSFDLVIDPFLTYELWSAFLAFLTGKYRIGFEMNGREIFFNLKAPEGEGKRTILEQTLELPKALGLKAQDTLPSIYLSEKERSEAWDALKRKGVTEGDLLVGIHPGGYYESQRWSAERFGEVGDKIISEYGFRRNLRAHVIIFGGELDKPFLEIMKKAMRHSPIVMDAMRLRSFIAVLSHCHLLICNNSGPLHIATALRIPTVSIMGPTVPYLWWPAGKNHIVLRKDVECSPCNKAVCKEHRCMDSITVAEVMEAAVRLQIAWIELQIERCRV